MSLYTSQDSDSEVEEKGEERTLVKLDDWICFHVDSEAAHLTITLRQKWHSLFLRRMKAPAKPWSQVYYYYKGNSISL